MNKVNENKETKKAEFEPVEIEIISFDTKTDIICTSSIEGVDDEF